MSDMCMDTHVNIRFRKSFNPAALHERCETPVLLICTHDPKRQKKAAPTMHMTRLASALNRKPVTQTPKLCVGPLLWQA